MDRKCEGGWYFTNWCWMYLRQRTIKQTEWNQSDVVNRLKWSAFHLFNIIKTGWQNIVEYRSHRCSELYQWTGVSFQHVCNNMTYSLFLLMAHKVRNLKLHFRCKTGKIIAGKPLGRSFFEARKGRLPYAHYLSITEQLLWSHSSRLQICLVLVDSSFSISLWDAQTEPQATGPFGQSLKFTAYQVIVVEKVGQVLFGEKIRGWNTSAIECRQSDIFVEHWVLFQMCQTALSKYQELCFFQLTFKQDFEELVLLLPKGEMFYLALCINWCMAINSFFLFYLVSTGSIL